MNYSYFPGCSLKETARDYDTSTRLVAERLGITLNELNSWVCCGANSVLDSSFAIKNISIAIDMGNPELICVCSACFNRLALANRDKKIRVRHFLDVLMQDIGISKIKEFIKREINLSCACYYGCLLTRPKEIAFDDVENPESMDSLMSAIGLNTKPWGFKTECCGGDLSIPRTDIVLERGYEILSDAKDWEVDCIVVACPLCQINLDLRQREIEKKYKEKFNLPILYFTELLGFSFGFDIKFNKHIVMPVKGNVNHRKKH
ncbi:MAG: CoB--CoM heterodisulfide reductase iron-sulfur subunit B family protein [bacterium]